MGSLSSFDERAVVVDVTSIASVLSCSSIVYVSPQSPRSSLSFPLCPASNTQAPRSYVAVCEDVGMAILEVICAVCEAASPFPPGATV